MDEKRARQLNGLQLAFIGDTIYDLFVRGDVLERHDESVQKLHKRAVARVNAAAQARAFDRVEPLLTQEEAPKARKVLSAAASTYLAAAFAAVAQLLRLLTIVGRGRNSRD